MIYLLVVAQFKSYSVPLVIMAPIPLTVIGVLPGNALLGAQFTATSMIGMIALAGIIVRNSILLVDFINEQVAAGMEFKEAVIQSAAVRARPITLTALAAILRYPGVDPADPGNHPDGLLRAETARVFLRHTPATRRSVDAFARRLRGNLARAGADYRFGEGARDYR
jgi:hypothetical protein